MSQKDGGFTMKGRDCDSRRLLVPGGDGWRGRAGEARAWEDRKGVRDEVSESLARQGSHRAPEQVQSPQAERNGLGILTV